MMVFIVNALEVMVTETRQHETRVGCYELLYK
jgi:hypothetical protein